MKAALKGKAAVIPGGGGGIGKAIAVSLAEEGVKLALCGGHNLSRLNAAADAARERGADVFVLPGDLADMAFLEGCIGQAAAHFGQLDILINNAGIALNAPFEATTADELDRIFAVNVKAPFVLCQKALPYLRRSAHAAIVNIASVVAHKGYVNQAAYAASKHALLGFSKSLAAEVFAQGTACTYLPPSASTPTL
jgi:3-oxoacyl-[acyl-carrier protein] reductase